MKKMMLVFCLMSPLAGVAQVSDWDLGKLSWLSTKWESEKINSGSSFYEWWTKISENELSGRAIQIKNGDTVFVEKLKIIKQDGNLFYVADVPENKGLVYFKFTQLSDSGFVCENPDHDFPKKISYQHHNARVKATISGNGKSIDYFFKRSDVGE